MGLRWTLTGLVLLVTGIAGAQVRGRAVASSVAATNATAPAVVKNAPFSAEVITVYDRTLDNGGHIHRETHGKKFRDSQGRVRTESEMSAVQTGAEKFERITINDPVQKVIMTLNPKMKMATIVHFGQVVGPATSIATGNVAGAPANLAPMQLGPKPEQKPAPGAANASKMAAKLSTTPVDTRTEALGNKIIEGVRTTGTRTTYIIDAGSRGNNDKPIASVSETWFSPELKTMVLTETDDGESGHSTMRLVNITRTEPVAQLFEVPSDYTVKDTAPVTASVKH